MQDDSQRNDNNKNNNNNDHYDLETNDPTTTPQQTAEPQNHPPEQDEKSDNNDNDDNDIPNTLKNDDDDDDVEFDDGGNIVGTSAPPKTHSTTTNGPSMHKDDDDNNNNNNNNPKKPRHMQVLQADRPPSTTSLHMTKLPNFVGIQPDPFDPDTYSASLEEREYRGDVHSMIRWRYVKQQQGALKRNAQGKLQRESNARIVQWEDGSYTLHVGDEVFDLDAIDSSSKDFAGLNGYLYLSQKATLRHDGDLDGNDDTPGGTVLECMGAIQSRLIPRPSSLQSEAHKTWTVAVRQRTIKKARIAEYVTQEDPEKAKQEKIRVQEDLEKASVRKSRAYRTTGRRSTPGMNRRYLEEDDGNYDTTNIRALKGKNMDELMDYGDDSEEDEEDEDTPWANNRSRPTRGARVRRAAEQENDDDDDEEMAFGEDSSEEEEEFAPSKKPSAGKKITHQAVLEDDDEDDD